MISSSAFLSHNNIFSKNITWFFFVFEDNTNSIGLQSKSILFCVCVHLNSFMLTKLRRHCKKRNVWISHLYKWIIFFDENSYDFLHNGKTSGDNKIMLLLHRSFVLIYFILKMKKNSCSYKKKKSLTSNCCYIIYKT